MTLSINGAAGDYFLLCEGPAVDLDFIDVALPQAGFDSFSAV